MKKYISLYLLSLLFFVFFPGIPSFCKDSLTYTSANEDSADPFEGIIFNLHFFLIMNMITMPQLKIMLTLKMWKTEFLPSQRK